MLSADISEVMFPGWDGPAETDWEDPGADIGPALGPELTVAATVPADGEHVPQGLSRIEVRFDRPLDPFSGFNDVILWARAEDGTWESLLDLGMFSTQEVDAVDPSVWVVAFEPGLAPGSYRIGLSAWSMLMGQDGAWLFNPTGEDLLLAEFEVDAPGTTRDDARDLGWLGPQVTSVSGYLDLDSDPGAVALYRIALPRTARHWRLGVEVAAQRLGSPLDSLLTLFDSEGKALDWADLGRRDAVRDPFLFAGLAPGVYYVGLSGSGNPGGEPGGYDLLTGTSGRAWPGLPGGAYTLHLVADPAETPPALLGFRLQYADPTDTAPTGFEVQFNAPLYLSARRGELGPEANRALEVVDNQGRSWPITASGYDEATSRLTFLFERRLPPGTYSVRVPREGGLTDLAGLPPVRPGAPGGDLATFTVRARARPRDANDLGTLFPGDFVDGARGQASLKAGESALFRFVKLSDGFARTTVQYDGGGIRLDLMHLETGVVTSSEHPGPSGTRNALDYLAQGTYLVRVTATGRQPVDVDLTLRLEGADHESLLQNGVGQGPALGARLIAPTTNLLGDSEVPAGADASDGPGASGGPTLDSVVILSGLVTVGNPAVGAEVAGADVVGVTGAQDTEPAILEGSGLAAAPGGLALSLSAGPVGAPAGGQASSLANDPGAGSIALAAPASEGANHGAGQGSDTAAELSDAAVEDISGSGGTRDERLVRARREHPPESGQLAGAAEVAHAPSQGPGLGGVEAQEILSRALLVLGGWLGLRTEPARGGAPGEASSESDEPLVIAGLGLLPDLAPPQVDGQRGDHGRYEVLLGLSLLVVAALQYKRGFGRRIRPWRSGRGGTWNIGAGTPLPRPPRHALRPALEARREMSRAS